MSFDEYLEESAKKIIYEITDIAALDKVVDPGLFEKVAVERVKKILKEIADKKSAICAQKCRDAGMPGLAALIKREDQ